MARAEDPAAAREQCVAIIDQILRGLMAAPERPGADEFRAARPSFLLGLPCGYRTDDAKGVTMGQPVVHFEIIGKEPAKLRSYFGDLFGWEFDTSSPVARGGVGAGRLRLRGPHHHQRRDRIPGGVGGGAGYPAHAIFYVGVPDVEAALQQAERLGGNGDGP